jgi:thiol:disulfide interchange protein DsbD
VSRPPGPARRPARARHALVLLALLAALAYLQSPPTPAGPPVAWRSDLESALAEAASAGRPAVLSFHAVWCSVCWRLDARSLRAPAVAAELERFERIRVDASGAEAATGELLSRFGVAGLPTLVFVDSSGAILDRPRVLGFIPAERLLEVLQGIEATGGAPPGGSPAAGLSPSGPPLPPRAPVR